MKASRGSLWSHGTGVNLYWMMSIIHISLWVIHLPIWDQISCNTLILLCPSSYILAPSCHLLPIIFLLNTPIFLPIVVVSAALAGRLWQQPRLSSISASINMHHPNSISRPPFKPPWSPLSIETIDSNNSPIGSGRWGRIPCVTLAPASPQGQPKGHMCCDCFYPVLIWIYNNG